MAELDLVEKKKVARVESGDGERNESGGVATDFEKIAVRVDGRGGGVLDFDKKRGVERRGDFREDETLGIFEAGGEFGSFECGGKGRGDLAGSRVK